ncbi:hypothetical protein L6452_27993 [Arctium lappa]|uniref:Uncharacterized protein n=1 Tax=Arctium lappa TaxID=4217 RepID=A0ACB8ZX78_ARCLA|nr:hypothetical protein L6452_27993 [Arctium lappa]
MPHMLQRTGPRRLPWPPGNTVGYGHGGATKKGLVKSSRNQGLLRQEQALENNSKRFPVTLRKSNYGSDSMKVYDSTVETAKVEANIVSYKIAHRILQLRLLK